MLGCWPHEMITHVLSFKLFISLILTAFNLKKQWRRPFWYYFSGLFSILFCCWKAVLHLFCFSFQWIGLCTNPTHLTFLNNIEYKMHLKLFFFAKFNTKKYWWHQCFIFLKPFSPHFPNLGQLFNFLSSLFNQFVCLPIYLTRYH